MIDGARVVHKWRETLPGDPPEGRSYAYDGISEYIYGGDGQWSFMWGMPDMLAVQRAHQQWREDGHAAKHGVDDA